MLLFCPWRLPCPTLKKSDCLQPPSEPVSLHPKISVLAKLVGFLARHKIAIGVTLLVTGLTLFPLLGGVSLITFLSGIAISTSVGLGVGLALCGSGFLLLCQAFFFSSVPVPPVHKTPLQQTSPATTISDLAQKNTKVEKLRQEKIAYEEQWSILRQPRAFNKLMDLPLGELTLAEIQSMPKEYVLESAKLEEHNSSPSNLDGRTSMQLATLLKSIEQSDDDCSVKKRLREKLTESRGKLLLRQEDEEPTLEKLLNDECPQFINQISFLKRLK